MDYTRKLIWSSTAFVVVFFIGAIGFKLIFGDEITFFDAVYQTSNLVTTVGASSGVPIEENMIAQAWAIIISFSGLGIVLYIVTSVTAFFVDGDLEQMLRLRKMSKELLKLSGHYVICGCGETGLHAAIELIRTRRNLVVIDKDHEKIDKLKAETGKEIPYIIGDATTDLVLEQSHVKQAAGVVTALPTDKDNLFVTITARQLNPHVRIVAKGIDDNAKNKLFRAGANSVVSPSLIGGMRLISEMVRPSVVNFLDYMLRENEPLVRIEEVTIPDGSPVQSCSVAEAEVQKKTGLLILAIREAGSDKYNHKPHPFKTKLSVGDTLVVLGSVDDMEKLRKLVAPKHGILDGH